MRHFRKFEAELWPLIDVRFFSAKYLKNEWTEFNQNLYTH